MLGVALTWRVERRAAAALVLRRSTASSASSRTSCPRPLGENVARVRFAALPIAVLVLSLRGWRPMPVAAVALLLAAPGTSARTRGASSAAGASTGRPGGVLAARGRLPEREPHARRTASRSWTPPATGPPSTSRERGSRSCAAGSARTTFRRTRSCTSTSTGATYLRWLRGLGVQLRRSHRRARPTTAPSTRQKLVASGRSGLAPVLRSPQLTVFAVPDARPIVTGPAPAEVVDVGQGHILVRLERPGRYRVAVRHSPYWRSDGGLRRQRQRRHARARAPGAPGSSASSSGSRRSARSPLSSAAAGPACV